MNDSELKSLIYRYNPYHKNVEDRIKEISEYLSLDSKSLILDAGCGEGTWSRMYKHVMGDFVGIDVIAENIKKNPYLNHSIRGNIEFLPFRDETFDLVICEWVVEHLKEPEKVMREFYRVLKKGGCLFIITSNIMNPIIFIGGKIIPYRLTQKLHRILYGLAEDDVFPLYYRLNTFRKIDEILTRLRFEKVTIKTANNPWYLKFNKFIAVTYILFERICNSLNFDTLDIYLLGLYKKKQRMLQ